MKIISCKIELFKDLSYFDYDNNSFDFHNDFDCEKIQFEKNVLTLILKKNSDKSKIYMKFQDTKLTLFDFNIEINEPLTIDSLYRGKFETNGILKEFDSDSKGYFYLEFYSGQKIEFWSNAIIVEEVVF